MGLSAKQFSITFHGKLEALGHKKTYWEISLELREMGEAEKCVQLGWERTSAHGGLAAAPRQPQGMAVWSKRVFPADLVFCRKLPLYRDLCSCSQACIPSCFLLSVCL